MPGIREVTETLREQLTASIPQDAAIVGHATVLDAEGCITVSPPPMGVRHHQLEVRVSAPGDFEVAYFAPPRDRRLFRGRVSVVTIASLGTPPFKRLDWVISWRGTHDWPRGESGA
jgi:hypothetical protein